MVLTDGYVTQEATKDFRFAFTVINNEKIMKRSLTLSVTEAFVSRELCGVGRRALLLYKPSSVLRSCRGGDGGH